MPKPKEAEEIYLVLDRQHNSLARAVRESPPEAEQWQVRILENKLDAVLAHTIVQLVGMRDGTPAMLGRIIQSGNDNRILVESLRPLGENIRQNLRIPTPFNSFIYPLTGKWKGRLPIQGNDLSCGGVSFFCTYPLESKERVELVLPVTQRPLILQCEILRSHPSTSPIQLYVAQFLDLLEDEVSMVREAVFDIQIQNRDIRNHNAERNQQE